MTYVGKGSGGTVILPAGARLPDGAEVEVTPITTALGDNQATAMASEPLTWGEVLKDVIGTVEGPPDMAENHDHYAHGF